MRNPNLRGDDDSKTTSSAYLEIADDNMADLLSKGKGIGLASKLADQLLQQANIKQLINNEKNSVNKNGSTATVAGGSSSAVSAIASPITNTVNQ
jgi:Rod binding domain-containing protein